MYKRKAYLAIGVTAAVTAGIWCTGPAQSAAVAGALVGTVKLDGPAPKRMPINMAKEPSCAAMHRTPPLNEEVLTDPQGDLQNVVVYVSEGLPDSFPDPPPDIVTITQKGCYYQPHVIAMQANQKLQVVNGDKTSHNIHPMPLHNREWNKSQPPGQAPFEETFAREEISIPVKCNIHPWMRAYIAVFRHPFFSVTNESGAFRIKSLPPGSYTIAAWHEKLGTVSQKVNVAPGEVKTIGFVFKIRPRT